MLPVTATDAWRQAHPGAFIGLLEVSGVVSDAVCPALEERKRALEASLRARYEGFTRQDFRALPVMAAYDRYYRRFNKTYHVQLQLESIVLKGKSLPTVSPAVDANFMAELETLTLAAGHDVARLVSPVVMDVTGEGERILQMGGSEKDLRPGDMAMRDAQGVACTIIYGQDARSPITPRSTHVLYVVYAPGGVPRDAVERHLSLVEEHVRLCSPDAVGEQRRVLGTE
jgi:DNA/RNA-binding domain of Phe-tRNA-synthetase-like protein